MRKSLGLALTASLAVAFAFASAGASAAQADTVGSTTFEGPAYSVGSVDQQHGWTSTGGFDQAVAATDRFAAFGAQSLRISNVVTSGAFGN